MTEKNDDFLVIFWLFKGPWMGISGWGARRQASSKSPSRALWNCQKWTKSDDFLTIFADFLVSGCQNRDLHSMLRPSRCNLDQNGTKVPFLAIFWGFLTKISQKWASFDTFFAKNRVKPLKSALLPPGVTRDLKIWHFWVKILIYSTNFRGVSIWDGQKYKP